MLSFLPQPFFHIGSVNIMMFDIMIVVGVLMGKHVLQKQAKRHALDQQITFEIFLIILFIGVPLAHIFGVLWGSPNLVFNHPMILLHLNTNLDSFGGFLGFTLGFLIYLKFRGKRVQPVLAYLDCVAYAMCFAWIFLRLGCAFSHDHPGRPATDFLAVQYPSWLYGGLPRHNLGLDEAIGTLFIFIVLYKFDRKPHQSGLICAILLILYSVMRFVLDYFRATDLVVSDIRYGSLTPAQWGCTLLFILGVSIFTKLTRRKYCSPLLSPEAEGSSKNRA